MGAFFAHTAHQPASLLAFMGFTDELKRALPDEPTSLVYPL